jgi:hypothetical protein
VYFAEIGPDGRPITNAEHYSSDEALLRRLVEIRPPVHLATGRLDPPRPRLLLG